MNDIGAIRLRVVACRDVEFALAVAANFKECLVGHVNHAVVPQPYVTQYEVDGRLVISVTLCVVAVTVCSLKPAAQWHVVSDASFLARAHPEPP